MDEDGCRRAWSAFADVVPSLCYIGRTREMLANLLEESSNVQDLISRLEDRMADVENPSLRTDLKILKQRLDWWCRRSTGKGSSCIR